MKSRAPPGQTPGLAVPTPPTDAMTLADAFAGVRAATVDLCAGLSPEDCSLQAMPDTSPAKWHLAHTTWFFETFVLQPFAPGYQPASPGYAVLFNSYYHGVGSQYPRAQRGLLSRPSLAEVYAYRTRIDAAIAGLLVAPQHPDIAARIELGMHHEAQHQELLLTDLQYAFFQNPLFPVYRAADARAPRDPVPFEWLQYPGGTVEIGAAGSGFAFDNETPRHPVLLQPFRLGNRLVTNREFQEFMESGGYATPAHWLADGWTFIDRAQIRHPLYWTRVDGDWFEFTLNGLQPLDPDAPVAYVSHYEAQAYAAWSGCRLPTEAEWEHAASGHGFGGNLLDSATLRPLPADPRDGPLHQQFGDCWEWTNSAYLPYPGYRAAADALGEYNGKFMSGQAVLRGGSCLSAAFHIRPSYRNFFYPPDRWQCTGIRLAADP